MILLYVISLLSIRVSSNVAFNTREKLFHILMNLPEDDVNSFKITGLITRSTRGVYTQQGFIIILLKYLFRIPFAFIAVVISIALIDGIFAGLFAAFVLILLIILIFKLNHVTKLFFKAKAKVKSKTCLFKTKKSYGNYGGNKRGINSVFKSAYKGL